MVIVSFKKAWQIYREQFSEWLLFFFLFSILSGLVGAIIPIVGTLFFLPMTFREVNRARAGHERPRISELWNFQHLGNDFLGMLVYALAQIVGAMACGVGVLVTWIGFWYTAEITSEARYKPIDTLKLSWAVVGCHFWETVWMALASALIFALGGSLGMGLGFFFVGPLVLLAWSFFWSEIEDEVHDIAKRNGYGP